jgi:hypothetical protein
MIAKTRLIGMTIGGTNQVLIVYLLPSYLGRVTHHLPASGRRYAVTGNWSFRRCSVCVDAGTFRDLTICRGEEVYADRGMLEVDPVTNVPRANLAPL